MEKSTAPSTDHPSRRPASVLRDLLRAEASGGLILMAAALLAIIIANSPLASAYFNILEAKVAGLSVLHWINDALMAVFFLLVGLEIKRELIDGHLSTWPKRILPGLAAAGGMIVPAVIYFAINVHSPAALRGWAIPTATDIAFALGAMSLLGSRVPVSLKIFLMAVAILDDLGAVAIIAAFYTENLSPPWLALTALTLGVLVLLNVLRVTALIHYVILGGFLWFFVLNSGVHATLAGVALALCIPLVPSPAKPESTVSPLHKLEHAIQPAVAYVIVPLFGFANAGVSLAGVTWSVLFEPVSLGIAAGLFVGKQVGIFFSIWLTVQLRWADRPEHSTYAHIYGIALLCGVGFTMSLFIGYLAFPGSQEMQDVVKIGVLSGSLLSLLLGMVVLRLAKPDVPQRRRI
jgi:NhaA family Na+:H+ antiporter